MENKTLNGTEKQIAWATDIKAAFEADIDQSLKNLPRYLQQAGLTPADLDLKSQEDAAKLMADLKARALDMLEIDKTNAAHWIEVRSEQGGNYAVKAIKELIDEKK